MKYMQYAVNELNNAYYCAYSVGTICVSCQANITTTRPVESSSDTVYTTNITTTRPVESSSDTVYTSKHHHNQTRRVE